MASTASGSAERPTRLLLPARSVERALRQGLLDLAGLEPGVRRLIGLGYAAVAILLALTLAFELFAEAMPTVEIEYDDLGENGAPLVVVQPLPVGLAAALASVVGWALVMTGATDCGRRALLPIAALSALRAGWLLVGITGLESPLVMAAGGAPIIGVAALHALTARSPRWRRYPGWEFVGWLALGFAYLLAVVVVDDGDLALVIEETRLALLVAIVPLVPILLLLGLEPVNMGVAAGRVAVLRLRRRLPPGQFLAAAGAAIGLSVVAVVALAWLDRRFAWRLDSLAAWLTLPVAICAMGIPLLVAVWGAALHLAGRWSVRAAATGLALAVASSVMLAWLVVVLNSGQDFLGAVFAAPGVIPPRVLFVALLGYNVMTFGASLAAVPGRVAPRSGRSLLYLGALVLLIACALISSHARPERPEDAGAVESLQIVADQTLVLGFIVLGPPYFAWLLYKAHRGRQRGRRSRRSALHPAPSATLAVTRFQSPIPRSRGRR